MNGSRAIVARRNRGGGTDCPRFSRRYPTSALQLRPPRNTDGEPSQFGVDVESANRAVANPDVFELSLAPLEVHIEGPRLRQVDDQSASQADGREMSVGRNVLQDMVRKGKVAIGDPPAAAIGQVQPHPAVVVATKSHFVELIEALDVNRRCVYAQVQCDDPVEAIADPNAILSSGVTRPFSKETAVRPKSKPNTNPCVVDR